MDERTRTWTATITVGRETIPATTSRWDLLRDQTEEAVREAALFLPEDVRAYPAEEVSVTLYKTTKARGTERDRTFRLFRDRRGTVRYGW
jgi:hypothetical protein